MSVSGWEVRMMNKLLIVDDEIEILEWLEELFLYDCDRELEVHAASSANEALKLLDRVSFEVVLTDIKMPGMDGLAFYEKIKDNWPECKVVFLTGYRNFEDIYRVNKNKDVRYVLKSEDDDVIMQAVEEAFVEQEIKIEQKRVQERQQSYMEKAVYWMRREYLNQIIQNPNCLKVRQHEQTVLHIEFDFKARMLLLLLRLDSKWGSEGEDCVLLEQYAERIKEGLPDWLRAQENVFAKRYLLLFIQPKDEKKQQWYRIFNITQGAVENVQKMCEIQEQSGFSAVISSQEVSLPEVWNRIERLKKIMVGYLGGMKSAIVHAEKSEELMQTERQEEGKSINFGLLKHYLELHQREAYFALLNDVCRILGESKGRHDMRAMEIYYNVSTVLLQFINDNHLQETLAFKIGLYKLLNVDEHGDWLDAGAYLIALSEEIFSILGEHENTLSGHALKRIVEYIDTHMDGDLSLTNLAAVGGFNASYLSRLFKQVHNEAVSDYVLKKRMELAKTLLIDTQDKIQDIGELAGYHSSNSFSRAFRGYTGVSPVEYREGLHAEKR